jgi:DNA-directed RNA polymerase subunit beta'
MDGLITQGEKYNKVVDIWSKLHGRCCGRDDEGHFQCMEEWCEKDRTPVYMMAHSGARGSAAQMKQLAVCAV